MEPSAEPTPTKDAAIPSQYLLDKSPRSQINEQIGSWLEIRFKHVWMQSCLGQDPTKSVQANLFSVTKHKIESFLKPSVPLKQGCQIPVPKASIQPGFVTYQVAALVKTVFCLIGQKTGLDYLLWGLGPNAPAQTGQFHTFSDTERPSNVAPLLNVKCVLSAAALPQTYRERCGSNDACASRSREQPVASTATRSH